MQRGALNLDLTPRKVTQVETPPGLESVRERLHEIARAVKEKRPGPRRVLIVGASQPGRTALLRAAAADSGLPLVFGRGTDFAIPAFAVARVRLAFSSAASRKAGCVLAVNDVDAFAHPRTPESPDGAALLQLESELQGSEKPFPDHVLFLCTVSRVELLDPTLTRPFVFDARVELEPDGTARWS